MQQLDKTKRNDNFVALVMQGKTPFEAGKEAGFSSPQRDAYKILLEKRAQDYARRFVKARCIIEGAPQAYEFMLDTMKNPKVDLRIRVVCAKEIMACGEIVAPKGAKSPDDAPVDPAKMNREQLIRYIAEAEKILSENAVVIEHQPVSPRYAAENLI